MLNDSGTLPPYACLHTTFGLGDGMTDSCVECMFDAVNNPYSLQPDIYDDSTPTTQNDSAIGEAASTTETPISGADVAVINSGLHKMLGNKVPVKSTGCSWASDADTPDMVPNLREPSIRSFIDTLPWAAQVLRNHGLNDYQFDQSVLLEISGVLALCAESVVAVAGKAVKEALSRMKARSSSILEAEDFHFSLDAEMKLTPPFSAHVVFDVWDDPECSAKKPVEKSSGKGKEKETKDTQPRKGKKGKKKDKKSDEVPLDGTCDPLATVGRRSYRSRKVKAAESVPDSEPPVKQTVHRATRSQAPKASVPVSTDANAGVVAPSQDEPESVSRADTPPLRGGRGRGRATQGSARSEVQPKKVRLMGPEDIPEAPAPIPAPVYAPVASSSRVRLDSGTPSAYYSPYPNNNGLFDQSALSFRMGASTQRTQAGDATPAVLPGDSADPYRHYRFTFRSQAVTAHHSAVDSRGASTSAATPSELVLSPFPSGTASRRSSVAPAGESVVAAAIAKESNKEEEEEEEEESGAGKQPAVSKDAPVLDGTVGKQSSAVGPSKPAPASTTEKTSAEPSPVPSVVPWAGIRTRRQTLVAERSALGIHAASSVRETSVPGSARKVQRKKRKVDEN